MSADASVTLQYLLFDASEGGDGTGAFDAMATVRPDQADAVEHEIAQVLAWAQAQFPARGAVEDGGDWDMALQLSDEAGASGQTLRVFSLSLAGSAAFCAAFEARFGDALA